MIMFISKNRLDFINSRIQSLENALNDQIILIRELAGLHKMEPRFIHGTDSRVALIKKSKKNDKLWFISRGH